MPLSDTSAVAPPATRKTPWLFLGALALAAFLGYVAFALTQSPTYVSTATVVIQHGQDSPSTAMSASLASSAAAKPASPTPASALSTATFGAGCFWCTQAVLERVDGVKEVTCGFMGGTLKNPTYEDVCTGQTGHAEVVQVKFDPKVVSYDELLQWFWRLHDPTSLNRQGADEGTQYRSVIFYYDEAQHAAALRSLAAAQKDFLQPIVTQIVPAAPFYSAEAYHQEYFNHNGNAGYCQVVIAPKLSHLGLSLDPSATKTGK
jgi:peptide-methionine (S)-S-oxide reductase